MSAHVVTVYSDVLPMPAAPVDVQMAAQPFLPGPAVYNPPLGTNM